MSNSALPLLLRISTITEFSFNVGLLYFQEEEILRFLVELGVCDGISQRKEMSVDGQPFHPVHKDKLQKLFTLAASPKI